MAELQEDQKQERLALEQYVISQETEINEILTSIRPPSRFSYLLFGIFAGFVDILDFFELGADVTGIGVIFVILLDICIAGVFLFAGYMASQKIKKIQNAVQVLQEKLGQTAPSLELPEIGTRFKNPWKRYQRNTLLQIIPGLDLWPWQLLGVHSLYKAHATVYAQAQSLAQQYIEVLNQTISSLEEAD